MNNLVLINDKELQIKEFKGERVITFKEIDLIHERAEGTAKRNFTENKKYFIKNVDYFEVSTKIVPSLELYGFSKFAPNGVLITESGYLMLVKSLTDDLAWTVQRELVNNYFRVKENKKPKDIKDESEIKYMNAQARLKNARAREAKIYLEIAENVDIKEYKQIMYSKATEQLYGEALIPLPIANEKTYSATEIGKILGVSANKVGSLANAYNLKTDEYGIKVWDKAKHSNKQVTTFRYYENVIPIIKKALSSFDN
ncbi:TPA: ORF6N domain-containing protein [Clostridioides difficile]|nr:ORF6N domain-containing protein [Clostridioides difficile]HBF2809084.1 ORF6N domain-containing protein [Clostridioides difficile]HBF3759537.1 ORF6N domain-containing protein [Clostridioides difficile]HBF6246614.1 ORF6N domain-containing protein [Clostridioides difficile]HBY3218769.1 ORF6N domain-containing protein [Clostridioides difficile]